MSERSERIIITVPKAHWCTIVSVSGELVHGTMVHQ
jgi:hypothetical protein